MKFTSIRRPVDRYLPVPDLPLPVQESSTTSHIRCICLWIMRLLCMLVWTCPSTSHPLTMLKRERYQAEPSPQISQDMNSTLTSLTSSDHLPDHTDQITETPLQLQP